MAIFADCSDSADKRWVPKDGLSVVTPNDAKTLFSSEDIRHTRIVVDAHDNNRTILFEVPEAFARYMRLSTGEPLELQMNGIALARFAVPDHIGIYSGPPEIPVPDKRTPEGSWLSTTILNRIKER